MNRIIALIIGILLFSVISIKAQNTYQLLISSPDNECVLDVIEYKPDYFVIVGVRNPKDNVYDRTSMLLKIKPDGDTTIRFLKINDSSLMISKIIPYDNNFFVFGCLSPPLEFNDRFFIGEMDENFSLKWHKSYVLSDTNIFFQNMFVLNKKDGGYYSCFDATDENYLTNTYFVNLDINGDTIETKKIPFSSGQNTTGFSYNADSTKLWLWGTWYSTQSSRGYRIEVDTSFVVQRVQTLPNDILNSINILWLNDTDIMVSGGYIRSSNPPDNDICIMKIDTSLSLNALQYYGLYDTIDYPAWNRNISCRTTDSIFFLGQLNNAIAFWPEEPSWIYAGIIDPQLHLLSEKRLGGDANYEPRNILATSDGGCIITAQRYDYKTQKYEYDIVIIKLAADDFITEIKEDTICYAKEIKVYPNPGGNVIYINSTEKNARMFLYDLMGKIVLEKELSFGINAINATNLKSGIYCYRIVNFSGYIINGKWFKI
ncbi:MAG: T9SS type A sorting domain-containing protein [Lentimicrobiaceae bacterium]|nr:T9SS type A sorting domain-containing protein [Lentimicrobiaceae bacterium]